jgi:hypothetical protein
MVKHVQGTPSHVPGWSVTTESIVTALKSMASLLGIREGFFAGLMTSRARRRRDIATVASAGISHGYRQV